MPAMRLRIANALLIDGSGAPARPGEVTIEDGRLAEVGEARLAADRTLDAGGLALAPGFIDMHSHGDFTLPAEPLAEAKVLQGVTTEVVGNCGLGLMPANARVEGMYETYTRLIFGEEGGDTSPSLAAYRDRLHGLGISVNAACLIPHGNVRCAAMGLEERAPGASELDRMRRIVGEGMEQGAFGLSTGLIYPPGAFAEADEVAELCKIVAPYGGLYATHMRDEGNRLVESVEEALAIGERAGVPVQISHHKAAGKFNWGKVKDSLARVDAARAAGRDVHSDVYPYCAGSTVLAAMLVPPWAFEGSMEKMVERLREPATRARIVAESQARILGYVPDLWWLRHIPRRLLLPFVIRAMGDLVTVSSARRHPEFEGKTLGEIARMQGKGLYDAALDLLVAEDGAVAAIAHIMREEDVRTVMRHAATMIGTDGFPARDGKPHPRSYGTYPRVLQHYVREEGLLTLEEAVHKMTGMPAAKLGLADRGLLRPGAWADLVLFDPGLVEDRATYAEPRRAPLGMPHVFVSGVWTVKDGRHTGARAGRVLEKRSSPAPAGAG
ncbi:MAG: D-aminoacylase [Candidatus Methylomirabilis sp.]|nr:D-aminoacylase [Deltaproteobacteria bacterium]